MSKLILFSNPYPEIVEKALSEAFSYKSEIKYNILYIPSNGLVKEEYFTPIQDWFINKNNIELQTLEETDEYSIAKVKIESSDIIIATGGNMFKFINWLRNTKFLELLKDRILNGNIVYIGFSAGAMLLTPNLEIAAREPYLENEKLKLTDLSGMNILDFEIFPHFSEEYENVVENYRKVSKNKVKTIGEKEIIVLDT